MTSVTITKSPATPMDLPVAYVAPGQALAEIVVSLPGWEDLTAAIGALATRGAEPRVAYAYQLPGSGSLLAKLVVTPEPGADEAALSGMFDSVAGARVISTQPPTETGLILSEQQHPQLVGTPAAVFGRPIIGALARSILDTRGHDGARLLADLGRQAGTLAASALPPLLQQLDMSVSDDLLARRVRDLQVMGWATFERATIEDSSRGEIILTDTFETAGSDRNAAAPTCHFLAGFIAGVFSTAWSRTITCQERRCQATGSDDCQFVFQPE